MPSSDMGLSVQWVLLEEKSEWWEGSFPLDAEPRKGVRVGKKQWAWRPMLCLALHTPFCVLTLTVILPIRSPAPTALPSLPGLNGFLLWSHGILPDDLVQIGFCIFTSHSSSSACLIVKAVSLATEGHHLSLSQRSLLTGHTHNPPGTRLISDTTIVLSPLQPMRYPPLDEEKQKLCLSHITTLRIAQPS
jgi:hypothetical protein